MKIFKIIIGFFVSTVLLCSFIFISGNVSSEGNMTSLSDETGEKIHWRTFQEAIELSKKEKRKIFIDVYTAWCGWCKVMDKNTFTNPVLVKYINEKYYAVKLDAEMKDSIFFNNYLFVNPDPKTTRSTHQLAASLLNNKMSYPTTVFLDENFSLLTQVPGYMQPSQLEPIIKYFGEDSFKNIKWEDYQQTFKSALPPENPSPATAPPH